MLCSVSHAECFAAEKHYTNADAKDIARVLYLEARGIKSKTEKACVVWVILNRVDSTGKNIRKVIREPHQFAFSESAPVKKSLYKLAKDVLKRWNKEKNGKKKVGRVLPKSYKWYSGDGKHNYFKTNYKKPYKVWDYSLDSPYKN